MYATGFPDGTAGRQTRANLYTSIYTHASSKTQGHENVMLSYICFNLTFNSHTTSKQVRDNTDN